MKNIIAKTGFSKYTVHLCLGFNRNLSYIRLEHLKLYLFLSIIWDCTGPAVQAFF